MSCFYLWNRPFCKRFADNNRNDVRFWKLVLVLKVDAWLFEDTRWNYRHGRICFLRGHKYGKRNLMKWVMYETHAVNESVIVFDKGKVFRIYADEYFNVLRRWAWWIRELIRGVKCSCIFYINIHHMCYKCVCTRFLLDVFVLLPLDVLATKMN